MKQRRPFIPGSNELNHYVHADNVDRADAARVGGARTQQIAGFGPLNLPAPVIELPQFDAGVSHGYCVDYQRTIPEQARERDTDTNLLCHKQARLIAGTNEFRAIEVQFRTAQPPASIHAREFDLHADRGAGPTLDFFLVLRKTRQE